MPSAVHAALRAAHLKPGFYGNVYDMYGSYILYALLAVMILVVVRAKLLRARSRAGDHKSITRYQEIPETSIYISQIITEIIIIMMVMVMLQVRPTLRSLLLLLDRTSLEATHISLQVFYCYKDGCCHPGR